MNCRQPLNVFDILIPSETHYEDKQWPPIWRDYVARKGMMSLPQALPMKYIKLEFTNLSEEPYPIYESGIEVRNILASATTLALTPRAC